MSDQIERVAVIGAGTMGAGIAAQAANAGLPVLLLDIVPRALKPEEEAKGLTLDHPAVRNRIVREGFERIRKIKPASFMSRAAERLVTLGNLEDDFEKLSEADWIVEAVVERLDVKRQLMERLEAVRKPGAVITTNTSGLPIHSITEGRSEGLRRHFFGTHFFNPPRYMKLLEIIPGAEADPEAVAVVEELAERQLGKGTIHCKDTPNFIGNRILSVHGSFIFHYAFDNGYRIEEVDAVTGPLLGRPKTATFRLQDLVGIDIAHGVAQNLYDLIPDDEYREVLRSPASARVVGALLERGDLGNKTGQGFYKRTRGEDGKTAFLVLNPETLDYEPPHEVHFPALAAVSKIRDLGKRLQALFAEEHRNDRGAQLAWATVSHLLGYAAARVQDIAYDLPSLDRALRWGFAHEAGPFELWDRLGVAETAERMRVSGVAVAAWVEEMLAAGCSTFYRYDGRRVTGVYDVESRSYRNLAEAPRHIRVEDLQLAGREIEGNESASLLDLEDGVLLLEFHSKMNTLDDKIVALMGRARSLLDEPAWKGLVIGNDGPNFTVGANLMSVVQAAKEGRLDLVKEAAAALQGAIQALRYAPKPTVAALHGMVLGGGCEIAMGVPRVVATAETYVGLVEAGVGLLPAGGGMKELVRRVLSPAMEVAEADPLPLAQKILETVGMAKVSTSAAEAAELGFFGPDLRIVMNRDHLLFEAKSEVLTLHAEGYVAPAPARLYAAGRDLLAALQVGVWSLAQAGFASEHDALVVSHVAKVLAGGSLSAPQWVDEAYFLELERQAFVDLLATEKTQARIRHTLETGKPLRN